MYIEGLNLMVPGHRLFHRQGIKDFASQAEPDLHTVHEIDKRMEGPPMDFAGQGGPHLRTIHEVDEHMEGPAMDLNAVNALGWSPLFAAIKSRNLARTEQLIIKGADVSDPAFLMEAVKSNQVDLFELVLQNVPIENVEYRDCHDRTPLLLACRNGNLPIAKRLIEQSNGVINTQTMDGQTALAASVESGNVHLAALLIQNGADADLADRYGNTPRSLATANKDPAMIEIFRMPTCTTVTTTHSQMGVEMS
jgi:hypothetical protein